MPKMMLGMAASISMAVPTTRATAGWTSSTSSSATTSASGTAMTIATKVERKVPASAVSAPYWPWLGDQDTVVRTLVPRPVIAGHELYDQDDGQAEHRRRDGEAARGGDDPEDRIAEPQAPCAAPPQRRRAGPSDSARYSVCVLTVPAPGVVGSGQSCSVVTARRACR